jgi:hypothetical protein
MGSRLFTVPPAATIADIIRENAACLTESLAISYLERSFSPANWILF